MTSLPGEGLVPLYVDCDVAVQVLHGFRYAVAPCLVAAPAHYARYACRGDGFHDPGVVGDCIDFIEDAHADGGFTGPYDYRLASQRCKHLARESGRSIPGRNHGNDFQLWFHV